MLNWMADARKGVTDNLHERKPWKQGCQREKKSRNRERERVIGKVNLFIDCCVKTPTRNQKYTRQNN